MKHNPPDDCCALISLKSDVKIDPDITIKIHHETAKLVAGFGFNPIEN